MKPILPILIALAAFGSLASLGHADPAKPTTKSTTTKENKKMKKYLLVIFSSPSSESKWASMTPEEMRKAVQKYSDFAAKLREEGRLVDAEGLSLKGKVLKQDGDKLSVTDGPYAHAKEIVGGYYIYTANSLEEATEIAKACPAIETGGTVEVREQMEY